MRHVKIILLLPKGLCNPLLPPPPPKKKTEIKIAGINSRFPSVSESEILRKGGAINTRKTGREQSLTCDILNVKEVGIESK